MVDKYIEYGKEADLSNGELDIESIIDEASTLWCKGFSADSEDAIVYAFSNCYDTITYSVETGSDKLGVDQLSLVRVVFRDRNDCELTSIISDDAGFEIEALPRQTHVNYWVQGLEDGVCILSRPELP